MNIAQCIQEYLAMQGINLDQNLKCMKLFFAIVAYASNVGGNFGFFCFDAKTPLEYANSILITSTITMATACFAILASQNTQIYGTIDLAQILIDKRMKTPTLRSMYVETNRVSEKVSQWAFLLLVRLTPICLVFPKATFIYFVYFTTDAGRDAFDLPFYMWFPFDWRTPAGYFLAINIQYIQTCYTFLFIVTALSLASGMFCNGNVVVTDLCASMNEINDNAMFDGNQMQITDQLYDFIETHSRLLELFYGIFHIAKLICMAFFTWCLVVICASLLLLQMEVSNQEVDYIALLATIAEILYVIAGVSISCELGERTSGMFNTIDDTANEIDWYLYPIGVQRMLPAIMAVIQKPICVELFGSVTASRETFRQVMKGGFSFFMVLRNFMK